MFLVIVPALFGTHMNIVKPFKTFKDERQMYGVVPVVLFGISFIFVTTCFEASLKWQKS